VPRPGTGEARGRARWRALTRHPFRLGVIIFLLILIIEYLVIPELVGASKDLYLLGRINATWLTVGLVLEGVSLFCYALLTRVLLPRGGPQLSLFKLFRIDLSAAAVAHVIPAGTVGSAGVGYTLFTAEGVPGTDVGVMMATKGMGSTVVLNVLLWLALVISIPMEGFHPIYGTVAIVGAVALAAIAALVFGLTHRGKRAARILQAIARPIPHISGVQLEQIVLQASTALRALASNRKVLIESLSWASLNWLLDAASLWCFVAAFGGLANPAGLFAAYGIANVLGVIPVTPAGLGVIDSVTPVLLVSFGLTRSVATLGVLAWRLVNFWLPIPTGAAAYISLKVPRGAGPSAMRKALADLAEKRASSQQQPAVVPPQAVSPSAPPTAPSPSAPPTPSPTAPSPSAPPTPSPSAPSPSAPRAARSLPYQTDSHSAMDGQPEIDGQPAIDGEPDADASGVDRQRY
jgi:uncharacterized protein (TIRG00374 family)